MTFLVTDQHGQAFTAKTFLSTLRKTSDLWLPTKTLYPRVFRGHANSAWELEATIWRGSNPDTGSQLCSPINRIPVQISYLRPENEGRWSISSPNKIEFDKDKLERFLQNPAYPIFHCCGLQFHFHRSDVSNTPIEFSEVFPLLGHYADLAREIASLLVFRHLLNARSEFIPQVSTELIKPVFIRGKYHIGDAISWPIDRGSYPWRMIGSLAAFARHCGFPTRLLDWSFDPLVAAYFAAGESGDDGARELVVFSKIVKQSEQTDIYVGDVSSERMKRQKGFTEFSDKPRFERVIDSLTPLNRGPIEIMRRRLTTDYERARSRSASFPTDGRGGSWGSYGPCLVLDGSERAELRALLAKEGYDKVQLFGDPGDLASYALEMIENLRV